MVLIIIFCVMIVVFACLQLYAWLRKPKISETAALFMEISANTDLLVESLTQQKKSIQKLIDLMTKIQAIRYAEMVRRGIARLGGEGWD